MTLTEILIVHFSCGGHTKEIADELTANLSAVMEPPLSPAGGGEWRMLPLLAPTLFRRPAPVAPARNDPAAFRCVLVGGPVWMGRVAPPVRGYLKANAGRFRRLGLFLSSSRDDGVAAFADMARLAASEPIATLMVTDRDRLSGERTRKILDFAETIEWMQATAGE